MSTLTDYGPKALHLEGLVAGLRRLAARTMAIWEALGEGSAAARRYRELTRQGMPHDAAAAKVFSDHFAQS
jgi:hypothetical protein